MPQATNELGRYIDELRQQQNLSWRRASYRCGLSPETLSTVVRRGNISTPRPATLQAIADGLGGNYERMMILAGHLEPPEPVSPSPEVRAMIDHLIDVYLAIRHDPAAVQAFVTSIGVQADALRAVACADEHHTEEAEQRYHNTRQFA